MRVTILSAIIAWMATTTGPVYAQSIPGNLPFDVSNFDISGIDPALIERIKAGDTSAIKDLVASATAAFKTPTIKVPTSIISGVVKTVGLVMDQKILEPATPLGTSLGLNAGAVVTLVKVPDDFGESMKAMGVKSGTNLPPALPTAGLVIQKGLGDIDIGGSYLAYKTMVKIYSGNIKWAFYQPEEGFTWAIRMCYTSAKVLILTTKTFSPQLLISRELAFADPYTGIGMQYVTGKLDMDIPTKLPQAALDLGAPKSIKVMGDGKAMTGNWFMGVRFKVPKVGLMLGMEGSYSLAGAHTMSVKLGLAL